MVIAAEAERTRSINPESEMPFAESQTDIKAGHRKIMHPNTFYLLLSFCHSDCVWVWCEGSSGLFKDSWTLMKRSTHCSKYKQLLGFWFLLESWKVVFLCGYFWAFYPCLFWLSARQIVCFYHSHMWHCWHWRKDFVNLAQNHSTEGRYTMSENKSKKINLHGFFHI